MKSWPFVLILLSGLRVLATPIEGDRYLSPSGRLAIVEQKAEEGTRFIFIDVPAEKEIGILNDATEESPNIRGVVARWSPDESKVATLLFYGTKLNTVRLFSKDEHGKFQEVRFARPEIDALRKWNRQARFDANGIGRWRDGETVKLLSGTGVEMGDGPSLYYVIPYTVRIAGDRGIVDESKPRQLRGHDAIRFLGDWTWQLD